MLLSSETCPHNLFANCLRVYSPQGCHFLNEFHFKGPNRGSHSLSLLNIAKHSASHQCK